MSLLPEEFERQVKTLLERLGLGLRSFVARQRERLTAADGEYEIDVNVRFEALGADFLVLVECKHQRRPVEREVVQILADRLRALGAQKGMLFTTSSFQSGALQYAQAHGIALVQMREGKPDFVTRSFGDAAPASVATLVWLDATGQECRADLAAGLESLRAFLAAK